MRQLALVAALAGLPGCTAIGAIVGGTTAAVHNAPGDRDDHWSVGTGVLIGAGIGLPIDILAIWWLGHVWSKPMT